MSDKIVLTLPDGKSVEHPAGIIALDAARAIGPKLAEAAIAAKLDGQFIDLRATIPHSGKLEIVTLKSPDAAEVYRHSMAHILAEAVRKLFPDAQFGIGPTIENGFYYDFLLSRSLTTEDLEIVEKEMKAIIAAKEPFSYALLTKAEAMETFRKLNQPLKLELIGEIPDEKVSVYTQGEFADLCRGPHLPHSGVIKHFKLLSVAGAYWRGDEKKPMLQRIYGTAFATKEELDAYMNMLEEAKKRDHRKLGKELDLFSVHEEVGPGLVFWHPKGARIRHIIESFWKEQHFRNGYEMVYTPHIGRAWLWETSGHLGFYKDSMYSPMKIDEFDYFIKPMNCPFHIMIYKTQNRSYRDLPLRWAELGTVYRYEKSGVLHGLLRVRGFTQDDAHILCTPEQIESEISEVLRFSLSIWRAFGFEKVKAYLATRPEKAVGEPTRWDQAIESLKRAVDKEGLECEIDEGGGAFYGPKIDLKIKDAIGREWQMTTIQFDFNEPERFDMTYIGADGEKHRPYMVHRALLGSLERFFGVLLEHHGGAMPTWLAPVQVIILPISDKHIDYAKKVEDGFRRAGIRVNTDFRSDKIGYKIRAAQLMKIPFMVVLGDEEANAGTITVRKRSGENMPGLSLEAFVKGEEWKKESC
ncbi:MAG: threonine--tRNA ligase [Candidatus Riflebacteria bacterium]|nr:threonine--tRNA ligase [Candidatus Riflebacteria bacterium]